MAYRTTHGQGQHTTHDPKLSGVDTAWISRHHLTQTFGFSGAQPFNCRPSLHPQAILAGEFYGLVFRFCRRACLILPRHLLPLPVFEKVIPDDTRDRAEALLLLARATIEKSGPPGLSGRRGKSPSEALETGIGHLRAALEVSSLGSFLGGVVVRIEVCSDDCSLVFIGVAPCSLGFASEIPDDVWLSTPPPPPSLSLSLSLSFALSSVSLFLRLLAPAPLLLYRPDNNNATKKNGTKRPARKSSSSSARSSTGTSAAWR